MVVPLESALISLYQSIVVGFPSLVYAIIILAIGYIIGRLVGVVTEKALIRLHIDEYVTEHEHLSLRLSSVFGVVAKWSVYLVTLQVFAGVLQVPVIIGIVGSVVEFIPRVVGAIVVLVVSYAVAIYAKEEILGSKELYSSIVGKILFFLVVYIGIATALPLLGVDPFLINSIMLLLVGAFSIGMAIALGWGLKDVVAETARSYTRKVETVHSHITKHKR